jgi:hypothetical protein
MQHELLPRDAAVEARRYPFRRTFVATEAVIGVSALAGTWMLLTDTYTPDVAVLEPLGLDSWTLPGVWLFASAAAPALTAAWLAWQKSGLAPAAVLTASSLLAVELLAQIPFLGLDPLQAFMGVPAVVMAGLALRARSTGWRPRH